jgi:hypothetical protein
LNEILFFVVARLQILASSGTHCIWASVTSTPHTSG